MHVAALVIGINISFDLQLIKSAVNWSSSVCHISHQSCVNLQRERANAGLSSSYFIFSQT